MSTFNMAELRSILADAITSPFAWNIAADWIGDHVGGEVIDRTATECVAFFHDECKRDDGNLVNCLSMIRQHGTHRDYVAMDHAREMLSTINRKVYQADTMATFTLVVNPQRVRDEGRKVAREAMPAIAIALRGRTAEEQGEDYRVALTPIKKGEKEVWFKIENLTDVEGLVCKPLWVTGRQRAALRCLVTDRYSYDLPKDVVKQLKARGLVDGCITPTISVKGMRVLVRIHSL